MRVSVADKLEITDLRPTGKGYLAVRANIARAGVYKYARSEIGLTDGDPNELVGVYRSPDFVFNTDSLATIAHKPVTLGHPGNGVSAKTWRKDAVGHIGNAVWEAEDRKHVQVDMLLMDSVGINAAQTTHKELSLGYSVDIVPVKDGMSPEGEPYVAEMVGVYDADHLALVPAGRAGSTCRVGDAAWPTEITDNTPPKKEYSVKKLTFDGISVSIDDHDAVESGVKKLVDSVATAVARAETAEKALIDAQAATATAATEAATAVQAKDAEIATHTATIATLTAQLADASSPEKLKAAAAAYAKVVDQAKALGATVADGASEADIKKSVVSAKLGDVAKDWTDAQVDVSFNTLAASAPVTDALRQSFANPALVQNMGDEAAKARTEREKMIADMNPETAAAK